MTGFVFALASMSHVKVGFTTAPVSRWRSNKRNTTYGQLTCLGIMPGDRKEERRIHGLLGSPIAGTREWFTRTDTALRVISALPLSRLDEDHPEFVTVAICPKLHKRCKLASIIEGVTLKTWVENAVSVYLNDKRKGGK